MSRDADSRRKRRRGVVGPIALIAVGVLSLAVAHTAWERHAARAVWAPRGHRQVARAARRGVESRGRRAARSPAVPTSSWIVNPTTGHEYAVVDAGSWAMCDAAAERLGGHLVAINDAAEQAWLVEQFGPTTRHWIGLTDVGSEGTWRWVTGEPVDYTNWGEAEPNDYGAGGEDYVHIGPLPGGAWNDLGPESTQWRGLTRAIIERPERGGAQDPQAPVPSGEDILSSLSGMVYPADAMAMALYVGETPVEAAAPEATP